MSDSPNQTRQVISLGAGTDTRYFRLRARSQHHNLLYHEFDFPSVCAAKRRIVEATIPTLEGESLLSERGAIIPDSEDPEWSIISSANTGPEVRYVCHPLDLRQLPSLESVTSLRGLQTDIPTLIISECCLCYLDVSAATAVIKWFTEKIPEVGIVLYEPIGPDDAFGRMMTENLAVRGIAMPTVQQYKTLAHQKERLADLGFREHAGGGGNDAVSIEHIWKTWVADEERERVDSLEGLDEVEEWQMLARHYAVAWGWKGHVAWDTWMKPQVRQK
jgi:[phosphatase 2A protein]-leucine-carboxy methyltransferase